MHWLLNLKKSLKKKVCNDIWIIHMPDEMKSTLNPFLEFIWILRKISAKKQDLSISNAEARQLAVMKEVLYDQQQVIGEYRISYKYCLASFFFISSSCVQFLEHFLLKIYILYIYMFVHLQLHDVLSKSDRMMAVVKDLFGDDPRVKINWSLIEY